MPSLTRWTALVVALLLALAAVACQSAPAPTPTSAETPAPSVAPTATPPCERGEPDCSPHPFDIMAQTLYQGVN